jgi:hypothetical protein
MKSLNYFQDQTALRILRKHFYKILKCGNHLVDFERRFQENGRPISLTLMTVKDESQAKLHVTAPFAGNRFRQNAPDASNFSLLFS